MPEDKKVEDPKQQETPEIKEEVKKEPKERTKKEFKKLKKSNQELKEQRDQYKSVLDSLRPKAPPPPPTPAGMQGGKSTYTSTKQEPQMVRDVPSAQKFSHLEQSQIDDTFGSMIDEKGYVDGNKLLSSLRDMNRRAREAEERARRAEMKTDQYRRSQEDFEETRQTREVHKKYSQIDPSSDDFNPEFFDRVRNELIGQMMQGKRDFMEAADTVYNRDYKGKEEEEVATKKEKEEAKEKENAKAQIGAIQPKSSSTSMSGSYKDVEHDALVEGTRKGTKGALAERLRRSGHGPA